MVFYGVAVHKRLNERIVYQIEVPIEKVRLSMPIATVNKSGMLPEGFIAVMPPDKIYEINDELDFAA